MANSQITEILEDCQCCERCPEHPYECIQLTYQNDGASWSAGDLYDKIRKAGPPPSPPDTEERCIWGNETYMSLLEPDGSGGFNFSESTDTWTCDPSGSGPLTDYTHASDSTLDLTATDVACPTSGDPPEWYYTP